MRKLVIAVLALVVAFDAMAWGGLGHRTVAEIAERNLTKKAKANIDKDFVDKSNPVNNFYSVQGSNTPFSNFKMFKQEFGKKIEQVIVPVFYQIQQKYADKFSGIKFEHGSGEGYGSFYIKGNHSISSFRITSPGFSKINIDITCQKGSANVDAKRITLEPEELEAGLLEDLLEQFILEYKQGNGYDS